MNSFYPMILGLMDQINDLNDKLNAFAGEHLDNVWTGVLILGVLLIITFWGIGVLNKK